MAHGKQSLTPAGEAVEAREILEQKNLTAIQKVRSYELQPSPEKVLWAMKKTDAFTAMNEPFNDRSYISVPTVGHLLNHMHQLRPASRGVWIEQYFKDFPYASFMALALRIASELNIPKQEAIDLLFIRTILEPWQGYESEVFAYDLITKQIQDGLTHNYDSVRYATELEDNHFAVDLVLELKGKIVFGIQVKPKSYFYKGYMKTKYKNRDANLKYSKLNTAKVFYVNAADVRRGVLRWISLRELALLYGYQNEQKAYDLIYAALLAGEGKGFNDVRFASMKETADFGIHLVLSQDQKPVFGISVQKPFYFTNGQAIEAKGQTIKDNRLWENRFHSKVFYMNSKDLFTESINLLPLEGVESILGFGDSLKAA